MSNSHHNVDASSNGEIPAANKPRYEKPTIITDQLFEVNALGCGKVQPNEFCNNGGLQYFTS